MNAPENITPINAAHGVLQKAKDALCVAEVAKAMDASKSTAGKQLKELYGLGLIESEPRAGGTPFYRLIADPKAIAPNAAAEMAEPLNFATSPEVQYLAPEDYEMPPSDPVLLAMANKMLGDRLDGVAHVLRGCGLPRLADASGAEDLQPKVAALAGAYQMAMADLRSHEACLEAKDAELLAQAKVVVDLRDQLEKKIQDHAKEVSAVCNLLDDIIFEPSSLADHAMEAVKEFKKVVAERVDLRDRLDALTQQLEADTGRITADLRAALESRSQVINEADRLRAELATERQAREALQEQDGVDVKDAAVGYLVRVTKRKPRYVTRPERARDAALAAVRAGAGRAEVLAVVPVGVARRGAEWQGINPRPNGD